MAEIIRFTSGWPRERPSRNIVRERRKRMSVAEIRSVRRETRYRRGRTRKRNLAVGQADKLLRDFSLALLSSIDVDSKLPRRKAFGVKLRSPRPRPRTLFELLSGTLYARIARDFSATSRFVDTSNSRNFLILSHNVVHAAWW